MRRSIPYLVDDVIFADLEMSFLSQITFVIVGLQFADCSQHGTFLLLVAHGGFLVVGGYGFLEHGTLLLVNGRQNVQSRDVVRCVKICNAVGVTG